MREDQLTFVGSRWEGTTKTECQRNRF